MVFAVRMLLHEDILRTVQIEWGSAIFETVKSCLDINLKSATTRLYDTEAKIICIVSKKGAQCIECHHKDI